METTQRYLVVTSGLHTVQQAKHSISSLLLVWRSRSDRSLYPGWETFSFVQNLPFLAVTGGAKAAVLNAPLAVKEETTF